MAVVVLVAGWFAHSHFASNDSQHSVRERGGRPSSNQEADKAYERGHDCWMANDYSGALEALTRAIGLDPHHAKALALRGSIYLHDVPDYERAVQDYSAAMEADPNLDLYRDRGTAYSRGERYAEAIQDYTKAIDRDPGDPYNWLFRGDAFANSGDSDRAMDDWTRCIALDPAGEKGAGGQAHAHRARSRYLKGDQAGAREDVRAARAAGDEPMPELVRQLGMD